MENNIEMIENMLNTERRNRRGNREIRFEVNSNYYEAVSKLLSDYKRVLKENEEKTTILLAGAEKVKQLEKENKKLKEDRNNNNEMVALARNEVLNYMTGYEDGKKHKMTATAQVVENQQYYIIQKQMEKYEEHIKRLKKENEKLKNKLLDTLKGQKVIKEEVPQYIKENYISKEKIKDKIEEYKNMLKTCNKVKDIDRIKAINERILELQELLEGRR